MDRGLIAECWHEKFDARGGPKITPIFEIWVNLYTGEKSADIHVTRDAFTAGIQEGLIVRVNDYKQEKMFQGDLKGAYEDYIRKPECRFVWLKDDETYWVWVEP